MDRNEIIFSEWEITDYGKRTYSDIAIYKEKLYITTKENHYSCLLIRKTAKRIKENSIYKISYSMISHNVNSKVIYGWYDNKGNVLVKGYVDNGSNIVSPKKSTVLEILVIVHSKKEGSCQFDSLKAEYVGPLEKKPVTLSTVCLNYQRKYRSCEKNMEETLEKIDEMCKKNRVDLIVLTESMYDRWTPGNKLKKSITIDSEPIRILRSKAKEYNTYLVFSIHEKDGEDYYNTSLLVDREGEIIGKYRKSHLTMSEYEEGYTPGDEIPVFDTDIGRIGIAVCWDLFYPEMIRVLQKKQVDIICHPTAGYDETRVIQRARENGVFIVTSGVDDYSHSAIFDPHGNKLADATLKQGYAVATVDINKPYYTYWLSYPTKTIAKNIYLNEKRNDLYK